jgi:hypothetical protein
LTASPPPLRYPKRTIRMLPLRFQSAGITYGRRRFQRWAELSTIRGLLAGIFADVNDETLILQVKMGSVALLYEAMPIARFKLSGGLFSGTAGVDVRVIPAMRIELDIAGAPTTVVMAVREPPER